MSPFKMFGCLPFVRSGGLVWQVSPVRTSSLSQLSEPRRYILRNSQFSYPVLTNIIKRPTGHPRHLSGLTSKRQLGNPKTLIPGPRTALSDPFLENSRNFSGAFRVT